ncbi:MAG TPA: hypothetical protein PKL78_12935 [Anaerolineales bacterium]|nr:hypothetical protein [Anaerolineales bacterium]HNO95190.1 hypothetical protein [Anaerolineales bacterium]
MSEENSARKKSWKIINWFLILFLCYSAFYPFIPIRYPVSCAQIIEPFNNIPKQSINREEFQKWIDEQYKWRNSNDVFTVYDRETYRVDWRNGNRWYLAYFGNMSQQLVALDATYGYHQIGSPRIDDVIFRNSQQPRFSKVIDCFGNPEYYIATTTDKHNIVTLWYPEKGMAIYGGADKDNKVVENFDVDIITFLAKPTTLENMIALFNQLSFTDYTDDVKFIKPWSGFEKINFVTVSHP